MGGEDPRLLPLLPMPCYEFPSCGTPRRVDRSVVPSEFHMPVRWGWVCRVPGSLERGPVALRDLCSARGVMGSPQAPRERPRSASSGGPRAEVSSSGARAGEKTFYHRPRCGPCSPVGQVNQWFSGCSSTRTLSSDQHQDPWELVRKANSGPTPDLPSWKLWGPGSCRLFYRPSGSLRCKPKLENDCLKLTMCGKANRCGGNVLGVGVGGGGVQA